MMFRLELTPEAKQNLASMWDWIAKRSADGALRWYEEFVATVRLIEANPLAFGIAPESIDLKLDLRQAFFKTPRGRRYRIVFRMVDARIEAVAVRGPGQQPLSPSDLA